MKDTDTGALPEVVLLATDGSGASASATRIAAGLSIANDSELHVVHAVSTKPKPPYPHFWEKEQIEDLNDRKRVVALAFLVHNQATSWERDRCSSWAQPNTPQTLSASS